MPGPDLHAVASEVLTAVTASFVANGRPVPERSYVAEGLVAADDVQLVVELESVGFGSPGRPHVGTVDNAVGYFVQLAVWCMRPAAPFEGDEFPTIAELNASAAEIQGDASAVLDAIRTRGRTRTTAFISQTFPGPQGGLAICRTVLQTEP